MTLIQTGPPNTRSPRGSVQGPVQGPIHGPIGGSVRPARRPRVGLADTRRPGPPRPSGTPLRYRGSGVGMSLAAHRRRPVTPATTVGLALLAAVITLWLGLVAHFGELVSGDARHSPRIPDTLAVVRVEVGESLQDVATRVAPDAPVREVAQRIRELNALDSAKLTAGQTLIAPVG